MKNPEKIREMFSSIAPKYDLANGVLSLGIHKAWRKELVNWIENSFRKRNFDEEGPIKALDLATGTGDVAIELKDCFGSRIDVLGTDFCEEMLKTAPEKAKKRKLDLRFEVADATKLPYQSNSFDLATISFGIRNVSDPSLGIAEITRVLKPGGQLFVLEFGQPEQKIFGRFYNFYSQKVLPRIGGAVTGHRSAYEYLEDSSSQFPCGRHFLKLMQDAAPLQQMHCRPLTMGIAYVYRAIKAEQS